MDNATQPLALEHGTGTPATFAGFVELGNVSSETRGGKNPPIIQESALPTFRDFR